jgi:uncharacterized membrane protein YkvA (DUF1232 family)
MNFSLSTLYRWYRHLVRNPQTRLWVIVGTIVYLFSPLDVAPDIFPFVGQIDDFLLVTILLSELVQLQFLGFGESDRDNQNAPTQSFVKDTDKSSENRKGTPKTVDVKAVSLEE